MDSVKKGLSGLIDSPLVIVLSVLLLALGPRVLNLDVFVGPDEFYWLEGSAKFTQALASSDLIQTYHAGHPGVTLMWAETIGSWVHFGLNGFSDWPAAVGADNSIETLGYKRQVVGVTNALILALQVLLVRQIFGSGVAWLAGFLLAFDPFLLTESRAVRTEGMLASLSTLALLALLLYSAQLRLRYVILVGALTGMAFLSKVSAVALLPIELLVVVGAPFWGGQGDTESKETGSTLSGRQKFLTVNIHPLMNGLRSLLPWLGAILLTVLLLWPALWVEPIKTIQQMYDYVAFRAVEGEGGGSSTFFWGVSLNYKDLGPLFYPAVLLYRTSPILWLGLALLGVTWPTRWLSRQSKLAMGIIILYLIPYLLLITLSELRFDRYTIPMLPALNITAALGLVTAWRGLTAGDGQQSKIKVDSLKSKIQTMAWLPAVLILGLQMALALPHHPYYYTYWNPLLGGLKQAVHVLPVGVGEGIDQMATYLNALPKAEQIHLALANSTKIEPIFKGQTIALDNQDGHWTQADYVMLYISQVQRSKHDPNIVDYLRRKAPLYTVTLQGLEYAWLYPGPAAQFYGGGDKLEGRGTLFGYNLTACPFPCKRDGQIEITAGDTLSVTLFWRNEGQRDGDYLFVSLTDLDGYIWAEAIAQPRPGFEEASRQENALMESEVALTLPIGIPPGDYFFKSGFRTANGEAIGDFDLPEETKAIHVTPAKLYPPVETFQPPQLTANRELALLGYELKPEQAAPGMAVWVTLYWQALTDVTRDYVILLRLLDGEQHELAYWLGRPVHSGYPTTEWQVKQMVQDPWRLQLPLEAQPGVYTLEIALFDAATETEMTRTQLGTLTVLPAVTQ